MGDGELERTKSAFAALTSIEAGTGGCLEGRAKLQPGRDGTPDLDRVPLRAAFVTLS
jgi:hypothetical protein